MPGSTPRKRNFVNSSNFASLNKINAIGNLSIGSVLGKKQVIGGGQIPVTPTISITPSITPIVSETPTNTPSYTFTPTATPTLTPTITRTYTPSNTITPTVTPTLTKTTSPTPFVTPTYTRTNTPTNSLTPDLSQTPTNTETPTYTPTYTPSPTLTKTPTFTPSVTETPTATNTPTVSPTVSNQLEYALYSVGFNDTGLLGHNTLSNVSTLTRVNLYNVTEEGVIPTPFNVDYVSVGYDHAIVGEVGTNEFYGAGNNNNYQLGLSSNVFPLPDFKTRFEQLSGEFIYLKAGYEYTMGLSALSNGAIDICFVGYGQSGNFGTGGFATFLDKFICGSSFGIPPLSNIELFTFCPISLATDRNNSPFIYGCGGFGLPQSEYILNYPLTASYYGNFNYLRGKWDKLVLSDDNCVVATSAGGDPYQWYIWGQPSLGFTETNILTAVPFTNQYQKFSKIVAGTNHFLALSANTKLVYVRGDNSAGQLGLGPGSPFSVSEWTLLDGEWWDIYAKGDCSWAKMADTEDWYACGNNVYGQLAINDPETFLNIFSGPIPLNYISKIESNGNSTFVIAPFINPTPTPTQTCTTTPTHTPTYTPSHTLTLTPTMTLTETPTETPTPTPSPTITPTNTETPTETPTPTPTMTPTETPDTVESISGSTITTIQGETLFVI